jgi:hypothetical protein
MRNPQVGDRQRDKFRSRIRQMGERSPKRRQEDGRVRFLRTLRERSQTFSISVPPAANGKSFTSGFVTEVD